jgi:hypothetical protein
LQYFASFERTIRQRDPGEDCWKTADGKSLSRAVRFQLATLFLPVRCMKREVCVTRKHRDHLPGIGSRGPIMAALMLGTASPALADCYYEPPVVQLVDPSAQYKRSATMTRGLESASSATATRNSRVQQGTSAAQNSTAVQNSQGTRSATEATAQLGRRPALPDSATRPATSPPIVFGRDRIDAKPREYRFPQPPSIAAVYQPLGEQVEVFAVDVSGALKDVWKHHNGFWEPSFGLTGPGFAPPGAPLAAVWQPLNEQLEVFTIGKEGALKEVWKAHNGRWSAPIRLTSPNFAVPCAHLAAVVQPLNNQLEVFAIDVTGTVRLTWKSQNGAFQQSVALTPPGSAPAGAPITAVWQPLNEQLEVFWIDTAGALRSVWKQHNGSWQPAFNLTAPGFASPRSKVAAVWQPLNEQLEVFTIDQRGAIKGVWKAHNSAWQQPFILYGPGSARPGAALTALWDQQNLRLHVITVGLKGEVMHGHKTRNGPWTPGAQGWTQAMAPAGTAQVGAGLAAVSQPSNRLLEVFTLDDNQAVRAIWKSELQAGTWGNTAVTRTNFGPIYGAHAANCTRILKAWSRGNDGIQSGLEECMDFMGINAHCARQDAYVTVGYVPQTTFPRFLQCTSRTRSDNVIEQAEHIGRGIAQGSETAMVAAAPFYPEIIQASGCVTGVLFACGTLAVDLAVRAGAVPPELKEAVDLANLAANCVEGDIVSCAKLGAAGARAVGVPIPGEDAGQVALMGQQCADGDFGACLRLGEKAAEAAGVPITAINQAAKSAQECYEGDVDACVTLGRQAARAGIPIGGVVDGANTIRQCSLGSIADCQELGQGLAAIPR